MMQLGFVSAILPECTLEEVFQTASCIGYDCVEVMCWPKGKSSRRYAGVTHINVSDLDPQSIDVTRKLCTRYGISISGLGYYPNALSPDLSEASAAVEHLRNVIKAASHLGIETVNTFVGRDWTKSVEDNWPRLLETWKPILDHAESLGVRIGIENCPMFFTSDEWPGGKNIAHSPEIWRRMFAELDSDRLGLNYDPSHMVFQHMDYLKPMMEFSDRLFHVHAKDVRIDRDRLNDVGILAHPNEYHSPKLPGMGEVDWGKFFSILSDTGYRGPVCVEVEDRAYERSTEDRKCALRQSHNYLRSFISKV